MSFVKTTWFRQWFSLGVFLTSACSLLSWLFSRRAILPSESTRRWAMDLPSIATAGFPFRVLELPQPPLGSDWMPKDMIPGFLLNELFWIIVGFLLAFLCIKLFTKRAQEWQGMALLLGLIGIFLHVVLFQLWFD